MQRRFRSCERFGKRSVVPRYSYDSRGRQDRPESAERMQEPIKRGGSFHEAIFQIGNLEDCGC